MKSAWTVSVHSMMRGQEQMFYDMIKCPDKMNQALHNITETLKNFIFIQDNLKPEDVG